MQTVVMPKMGDTMEEGKILSWHKQEGDTVEKGEALAEIETEKVNIEAESFFSGVLRKILVPAGESVPVGAAIALVGQPSEAIPAEFSGAPTNVTAPAAMPEPGGHAEAAPEQTMPQVVAQPLTAQGHTRPEQPVPTAEAGVSAARQPAPAPGQPANPNWASTNGYVANGHAANGATIAGATATALPQTSQPTQTTQTGANGGRIFISPIARRIAQEHALDPHTIQGTGPGGRILREDVEAALARPQPQPYQAAQVTPQAAPQPTAAGEEVEAVPLTAMRRTIAKRLQQSMQTAPHFYVTMAIDMTRAGDLRAQINEYAKGSAQPVKVSFNDLIVKAVALSLARMPEINVSFDGERILRKKRVNVGVAVALEQGLIVPVVRDADKLGVLAIARETLRLAEAARTGKLKPEEFSGGTFSISNLGMYGVDEFTAVINPPESAILAVGAIEPTPVVVDGQVTVRNRMKVTLSSDHRAIDGVQAARFLQEVRRLLEQPMGMLL